MIEIVGRKRLKPFANQNGELIDVNGYNYFFNEVSYEEGLEGVYAGKKYLSLAMLEQSGYIPDIGDKVRFEFNSRGKICGVTPIS